MLDTMNQHLPINNLPNSFHQRNKELIKQNRFYGHS